MWAGPVSIAVSGDGTRCVVGSSLDNCADIYVLENDTWILEGSIYSDSLDVDVWFGRHSVSINHDGSIVAAGSYRETPEEDIKPTIPDTECTDTYDETYGYEEGGVVYVYTRKENTWTRQATLIPVRSYPENHFGKEVRLTPDGQTLVVSASGSVTIFTCIDNVWKEEYSFTNLYRDVVLYATSIDVSDDGMCIVVGTPSSERSCPGRVSVYTKRDDVWFCEHITDDDGFYAFGTCVSITSDASRLLVDNCMYVKTDGHWELDGCIEPETGIGTMSMSRSGDRLLCTHNGTTGTICGSYREPPEPWIAYVFKDCGTSFAYEYTIHPVSPIKSEDDDWTSDDDDNSCRSDVKYEMICGNISPDGKNVFISPTFVESRYVPVTQFILD